MKWLALVLFFIQTGSLLPCVFDRVDKFHDSVYKDWIISHENGSDCFSACYNDKDCIGFNYYDNMCDIYTLQYGTDTFECDSTETCFTLQRDEVDPVCKKYVNV
ncbi:unnamed protein product [Cylicocyclus nassatus]|uniref:Apple domain-containing protein n=1 Tax=Cylicocyclus nassatus TaxID=53992 RepID=A0AA36DLM2_CYLNA|nr:unnamed protein product [Cylicocyclus nassatus]